MSSLHPFELALLRRRRNLFNTSGSIAETATVGHLQVDKTIAAGACSKILRNSDCTATSNPSFRLNRRRHYESLLVQRQPVSAPISSETVTAQQPISLFRLGPSGANSIIPYQFDRVRASRRTRTTRHSCRTQTL